MIALPANLDRKAFEAGSQPVCNRRPPGSIDVREAVRRAINSQHYDGSKDRAAVRSWVHRLARSADPDLAGSVAGKLWLHPSPHPAFSKLASSTKEESGQAIAKLTDAQRAKALLKAQVLRDFDLYLQGPAGAHGVLECRERFVRERSSSYTYADGEERKALQLSTRTLIRWQAMYRGGGIDALARDGRGRPSSDGPSEEAAAMYWSARNDPRKWSIAQCWRMVTVEARKQGWRWFTKLGACRAWDRSSRDTRALMLNRQGEQRYT